VNHPEPLDHLTRGVRSAYAARAKRSLIGGTLALVIWLAPALVNAADGVLSIYREALTNDPTYLAAAASTRATRELRPQARAALMPRLDAGVSATYNEVNIAKSSFRTATTGGMGLSTFTDTHFQVTLTQPLYRRDLYIRLQQASSRIQQAEVEFALAGQDLIIRVAERYFGVLQALDDLEFARAVLKAFGEQLKQAQQRFDVGLIAITDVEESKAGFDLATSQVIDAQNKVDNAREALREVTGSDHPVLAALGDKMPLVTPRPDDIDAWAARAVKQNFAVLAAGHAATVAKDEITRVQAGHLPTLDLVGRHTRDGSDNGGGSLVRSNTVSFQLNIPLFQGGLVLSQTRQSRHLYEQAQEELDRQRRSVERQTRDDFLNVRAAIAQVKALRQAVRSNESATQAIKAGFEVGTRTSVDVLDAQRDLFQARSNLSAARYQYILDVLRLKQAAGTLAEPDIARVEGLLRH